MGKILEPLPYFKWFWRDWRANRKVQRLHYVARGLYRDLLDEQWENGCLPPEIEELADICGCPVQIMDEHWPALKGFFEEQEDGSLVNSKLEKQRTDEDATRAKKAKGGRASALAKLNKPKQTSTPVEHLLESLEDAIASVAESHIAEQSRAIAEQSISEQDVENFEELGETDMNLKAFKAVMTTEGAKRGVKVSGYDDTWDELKILTVAHGSAAVISDFGKFLDEGGEYPKGALVAYKWVAADRLNVETPVVASAKDPEVVSLARELSYLSDGVVAFVDKQRIRLADVLREFSAAEIQSAFKTWLGDQDLSDPKNVSFLAGKFVQIVDSLCYSARRKKQESDAALIARTRRAAELQQEAEAERAEADKKRLAEENIYDPVFGDLENVVQ